MKGQRIAWTRAQLTFIKRRKKRERRQLYAEFVKKFPRSGVSLVALCSLCKRSGWLTGPRTGRGKGIKPTIMAVAKLEHKLREKKTRAA